MTIDGSILAFTGIVAILTILPGADMALVAKVTLLDGRRSAFFTSLGICAGLPVHATASALGLSLILATSAEAFTVVKFAGATYLAYLGIRTIRDSLRPTSEVVVDAGRTRSARAAFVQGWLTNVLNPKVALSTSRSCHSSYRRATTSSPNPCCSLGSTRCSGSPGFRSTRTGSTVWARSSVERDAGSSASRVRHSSDSGSASPWSDGERVARYGPWALPGLASCRCGSSGPSWLERSPSL